MAVTHTEEGGLDAMSTAVLIARLHREGKLRPVFDEAMGTHVFVDLETGQVNMTQGRPAFRVDTNWEGSNYLTINIDLVESVAAMSGRMGAIDRFSVACSNDRLVRDEDLTHRAYDRLVTLIGYIDNEGA